MRKLSTALRWIAAGVGVVLAAYALGTRAVVSRMLVPIRSEFAKLNWSRLSFRNEFDGTGPLHAIAVWPKSVTPMPMLVVMHGFRETAAEYFSEACYWARHGYFVVVPDMRGRHSELRYPIDLIKNRRPHEMWLGWHSWVGLTVPPLAKDRFASAGTPDSCGVEVLDIHAAVLEARRRYEALLTDDTAILGYSGGGSHALLAAARTPYFFQRAVAFFPIVDFAAQAAHLERLGSGPLPELLAWMGGKPEDVPHRYAARNVAQFAGNLRHTHTYVFADEEDPVCPVAQVAKLARAAESSSRLQVSISGPGDDHRWHHSTPDEDSALHIGASAALAASGSRPSSTAAREEVWLVGGYLVAPDYEILLGDLQTGVVKVTVLRDHGQIEFRFEPVSAPDDLLVRVRVRAGPRVLEERQGGPRSTMKLDLPAK